MKQNGKENPCPHFLVLCPSLIVWSGRERRIGATRYPGELAHTKTYRNLEKYGNLWWIFKYEKLALLRAQLDFSRGEFMSNWIILNWNNDINAQHATIHFEGKKPQRKFESGNFYCHSACAVDVVNFLLSWNFQLPFSSIFCCWFNIKRWKLGKWWERQSVGMKSNLPVLTALQVAWEVNLRSYLIKFYRQLMEWRGGRP